MKTPRECTFLALTGHSCFRTVFPSCVELLFHKMSEAQFKRASERDFFEKQLPDPVLAAR